MVLVVYLRIRLVRIPADVLKLFRQSFPGTNHAFTPAALSHIHQDAFQATINGVNPFALPPNGLTHPAMTPLHHVGNTIEARWMAEQEERVKALEARLADTPGEEKKEGLTDAQKSAIKVSEHYKPQDNDLNSPLETRT